jgi:hypothetical protein
MWASRSEKGYVSDCAMYRASIGNVHLAVMTAASPEEYKLFTTAVLTATELQTTEIR